MERTFNNSFKDAVCEAIHHCAENAKDQKCYICNASFKNNYKTSLFDDEGLVCMCACRAEGFVHISCLIERARILTESAWNNYHMKMNPRIWTTCSLCQQKYHGPVLRALGCACFKGHYDLLPRFGDDGVCFTTNSCEPFVKCYCKQHFTKGSRSQWNLLDIEVWKHSWTSTESTEPSLLYNQATTLKELDPVYNGVKLFNSLFSSWCLASCMLISSLMGDFKYFSNPTNFMDVTQFLLSLASIFKAHLIGLKKKYEDEEITRSSMEITRLAATIFSLYRDILFSVEACVTRRLGTDKEYFSAILHVVDCLHMFHPVHSPRQAHQFYFYKITEGLKERHKLEIAKFFDQWYMGKETSVLHMKLRRRMLFWKTHMKKIAYKRWVVIKKLIKELEISELHVQKKKKSNNMAQFSDVREVRQRRNARGVVMYNEIKPSDWHYEAPLQRAQGKGAHLYINLNEFTKKNCRFQTPTLKIPFAVRADESADWKSTMFANIEDDVLMEKLQEIDESLLNAAFKNQSTWWPGLKEKDKDWISSKHSKVVIKIGDSRYPPKMEMEIIHEGHKQATKFYKQAKKFYISETNQIGYLDSNIDCVTAGSKVVAMVSIQGAWISHYSMTYCFGLELRAEQVLVYQQPETRSIHQFKLSNEGQQMTFKLEADDVPMENTSDGMTPPVLVRSENREIPMDDDDK